MDRAGGLLNARGSILIVALWVLALLALVAAGLAHTMGLESRLTRYAWEEMRLRAAAETSVFFAADAVRTSTGTLRALNEPWSRSPDAFLDRTLGEDASVSFSHRDGDETLHGLEDESGRINVNTAPREVLERLFPAAPEVAEALLAWRSRPAASDGEEEDGAPRHGHLKSVEELLLIEGMTPALFSRAEPLVTVLGKEGRVNLNTASEAVLDALGMAPSLAGKILRCRRGEDGRGGTEDDVAFSDMPSLLSKVHDLAGDERGWLANPLNARSLGFQAGPLRLNARVSLPGSAGARRDFRIIIADRAWPPVILSWRESAP